MHDEQTVRSLTSYLRRKKVTFSICSIINHCSACGDVLSFARGLTLAFGRDVSAKFGRRLFEAFICHESNSVDCSSIVAMHKALVYAAPAYWNPRSIFLKILDEYTQNGDMRCDYKKLDDILKIISIAAVTNNELGRTSGLLQDQLGGSTRISMIELEKALDSCPSVLDHFRLQLVNQMTSDEKIELLCALESESLGTFIKASKAIGVKRIHAFKMRRLLRCFEAWRLEVELSHRLTKRRKKRALSEWNEEAQRLKTAKALEEVSIIIGYTAKIRRSFVRWRKLNAVKYRIQSICLSEDIDKEVRSASGHLRVFAKKLKRRLAFSTWISFTLIERRCEDAKHWQEGKTVKLAFHALHKHASLEIQQRKRTREASLIQQRKSLQLQQQSLELERKKHLRRPKSKKWTSVLALASSPDKSQTRQLSQDDIDILNSQRELRRKRVEYTKLQMESAMNIKWLSKQSEFEASLTRQIEAWKSSAEYKCLFEDQEKKYKIILSDTIDEDTERALTSDDVISYSILDGLLLSSNVDPGLFLKSLPDPFDIAAFKRALDGVNFTALDIESIFERISGQSKSMSTGRLRELQHLSYQYVGQEGSLWKIYAFSGRIQFHNISSGQTIATIRKKHIRQVIRENLPSCEMFKARRTFSEMKEEAYRSMWEQHAAKTIQFMFRRWKGRHQVRKKLWVVDRLRLKTTKEKEMKAARVIQDAYRRGTRETDKRIK